MSKKPKSSAAKGGRTVDRAGRRVDRPFAAEVLRRAETLAARYQIVLQFEDGEWYGRGLELPLTMDDGKTPDECVTRTRRALVATVAYMLEKGQTPPVPATDGRRTEQVNVRLTAEEKSLLEDSARRLGYQGVSDYVRAAAVEGANTVTR